MEGSIICEPAHSTSSLHLINLNAYYMLSFNSNKNCPCLIKEWFILRFFNLVSAKVTSIEYIFMIDNIEDYTLLLDIMVACMLYN